MITVNKTGDVLARVGNVCKRLGLMLFIFQIK